MHGYQLPLSESFTGNLSLAGSHSTFMQPVGGLNLSFLVLLLLIRPVRYVLIGNLVDVLRGEPAGRFYQVKARCFQESDCVVLKRKSFMD